MFPRILAVLFIFQIACGQGRGGGIEKWFEVSFTVIARTFIYILT